MAPRTKTARTRVRTTAFPVFGVTPQTVALALARAAGTLLSAASALLLGALVDDVAAGGLTGHGAAVRLLAFLAVSLVAGVANVFLVGWLPLKADLAREIQAHERAADLVLALPQRAFARRDTGHWLNLVISAAPVSASIYVYLSVSVVGSALAAAVLVGALALVDPALCLVFAVVLVAELALGWGPARAANRLQTQMLSRREAWLDEGRRVVEERRAVAASGAEAFFSARYEERTEKYRRFRRRYKLMDTIASTAPGAAGLVGQALSVAVAAVLAAAGRVSAGGAVAAWQLFSLAREPATDCVTFLGFLVSNRVNVEQLRDLERASAEPSGFERLRVREHPADGACEAPDFRMEHHAASEQERS